MSDRPLRLAWGWVDHLRAGGTTPWSAWLASGAEGDLPSRGSRHALPGAQQLELLRVLNERGGADDRLVARVLEASAPGRGRPDLELVGVAEPTGFGLPPVDPAALPRNELLRVALSLLAEDLVAAGVPQARAALVRPWRRRVRVVGDPWLAAAARDDLLRRGRPEGGRGTVTLVAGADTATMLAHVWTSRACSGGVDPWPDFVEGARRARRLPPRADLLGQARWWAERTGRDRVHVVLDPALLARQAGVRRPLAAPPLLGADAAELCRRLQQVLGILVLPQVRADLLRLRLAPRLAALDPHGPPLGVPEPARRWLERVARRQRDGLLADGYAVHGDPDRLLPTARPGTVPSTDGVFGLAMRLLLEGGAGSVGRGRS